MGSLFRIVGRRNAPLSVPACAVSFVQRRDRKNVRHSAAFTTWKTWEQIAFFVRGIDAEPEYWHAPRHALLQRLPGVAMAIPARETERDQSLATGLAARLACRRGSLRGTT